MIGWIALAITVAIFASIAMRIDDWGRDWTQNQASLDPNARRQGLRPVALNCSVQEAENRIRLWTEANPRWDFASESKDNESPLRLKLTRTTAILKFVDDIEVDITANPTGNGVVVTATSQSRLGKGDLGQNPRNLIELTTALGSG